MTDTGIYLKLSTAHLSPAALECLEREDAACAKFGHLDDWLVPLLSAGARDIIGYVRDPATCSWIPVGTLAEYLAANLQSRPLSYLDVAATAQKLGARVLSCCGGGFYLGYGRSLTGDRWYRDIARFEFRQTF